MIEVKSVTFARNAKVKQPKAIIVAVLQLIIMSF